MESDLSGRIVFSKRGRDRGGYFIVVRVLKEDIVLIADGKSRKLEKPKKKKMKHLGFTEFYLDNVREMLLRDESVTNRQISAELQKTVSRLI